MPESIAGVGDWLRAATAKASRAGNARSPAVFIAPLAVELEAELIQGQAAARRPDHIVKIAEVISSVTPDIVGLQEARLRAKLFDGRRRLRQRDPDDGIAAVGPRAVAPSSATPRRCFRSSTVRTPS